MTKNGIGKEEGAQGDVTKREKEQAKCACDGPHDVKNAPRSGRVVIKSTPSKTSRISLRNAKTKTAESQVRPPWNASPTTSKATSAQSKRTIRTLPRKLPVRPKLPTQDAFSPSPIRKDEAHKPVSFVEARPIPSHSSRISSKTPPKDPNTGHALDSSNIEEPIGDEYQGRQNIANATTSNDQPFLQQNLKFIQHFIDSAGLKTPKSNAALAAVARAYEQEIRNVTTSSPSLIDLAPIDTFVASDITTSPQLNLPTSLPAAQRKERLLSDQVSPGWISPLVQFDQKSFDNQGPSIQWATKPNVTRSDVRSQPPNEGPASLPLFEQRTLEEEQSTPQDIFHSRSSTTKHRSPLTRVLPRSKFWLDSEISNDEQPMPRWEGKMARTTGSFGRKVTPYSTFLLDACSIDGQAAVPREGLAPTTTKTPFPSPTEQAIFKRRRLGLDSVHSGQITLQVDEQPFLVRNGPQQAKHTARPPVKVQTHLFIPSKPAWPQTAGDEVACHTEGDSTEEDLIEKSKSIINRSRRLRQSQSLSNLKSVKWDPAIIACGPVTGSKGKEEHSQRQRKDPLEASKTTHKKAEMERGLETFRKTISQWKKGDRKAIEKFLEALKNLDSDEESVSASESVTNDGPKKIKALSHVDKCKRMNPHAPEFQAPLLQKADGIQREMPDLISFESTENEKYAARDVVDALPTPLPIFSADSRFPDTLKQEPIWINTFQPNIHTSANIAQVEGLQGPSRLPEYHKQEPIWINTLQPPSTISAAGFGQDEDFQEFCRVNNFVPLVPADTVSYPNLQPDFADKTYPTSFGCFNAPVSSTAPVDKHYYQSIVNPGPILALEKTSDPLDDGFREAKTLDSAWGAQVLENFMKKYPKTGQRADPASEKSEDANSAAKPHSKQQPKSEGKTSKDEAQNQKSGQPHQRKRPKTSDKANAPEFQHNKSRSAQEKAGGLAAQLKAAVRAHRREASKSRDKARAEDALRAAANIQQKLEMVLLHEKEDKAQIRPAHKVKATQIQETLELMLYKIKEQKALEGFSRNVKERIREIERSSEDDVRWYTSRSTSDASRNGLGSNENLS